MDSDVREAKRTTWQDKSSHQIPLFDNDHIELGSTLFAALLCGTSSKQSLFPLKSCFYLFHSLLSPPALQPWAPNLRARRFPCGLTSTLVTTTLSPSSSPPTIRISSSWASARPSAMRLCQRQHVFRRLPPAVPRNKIVHSMANRQNRQHPRHPESHRSRRRPRLRRRPQALLPQHLARPRNPRRERAGWHDRATHA